MSNLLTSGDLSPEDDYTRLPPPPKPRARTKSLVLVARKLAKIPGRADLAVLAAPAGWETYEGSWDSDNGSPVVRAFEADEVAVVLVGRMPAIEGRPVEELLLERGFAVLAVDDGCAAVAEGQPALWLMFVVTLPTGRAPLPLERLLRLPEFNPTAVLRAVTPPAA